MVQPVLEWRRGAMRRDLRVGTYAFGGATPGDQRVLAALGAGRRPAASFYGFYQLAFMDMIVLLLFVTLVSFKRFRFF